MFNEGSEIVQPRIVAKLLMNELVAELVEKEVILITEKFIEIAEFYMMMETELLKSELALNESVAELVENEVMDSEVVVAKLVPSELFKSEIVKYEMLLIIELVAE